MDQVIAAKEINFLGAHSALGGWFPWHAGSLRCETRPPSDVLPPATATPIVAVRVRISAGRTAIGDDHTDIIYLYDGPVNSVSLE